VGAEVGLGDHVPLHGNAFEVLRKAVEVVLVGSRGCEILVRVSGLLRNIARDAVVMHLGAVNPRVLHLSPIAYLHVGNKLHIRVLPLRHHVNALIRILGSAAVLVSTFCSSCIISNLTWCIIVGILNSLTWNVCCNVCNLCVVHPWNIVCYSCTVLIISRECT
jgi:hypothetical protein